MKIYIAGKVTGDENYREKFESILFIGNDKYALHYCKNY